MSIPSLWTSTQFQNWKSDCAKCTATHAAFKVIDVNNAEQEAFCVELCALEHYSCTLAKCVATCTPVLAGAV